MERSNSSYKERGSEASTADSLGIKDAAKESSKGQNFEQRAAGNAGLTELVVHEALGIDSRASMEMNLAGQISADDCGHRGVHLRTGRILAADVEQGQPMQGNWRLC